MRPASTSLLRRLFLVAGTGLLLVILATAGVNVWITSRCRERVHTGPALVPAGSVALVLGTGKYFGNYLNGHFRIRMDAAAALYHAGKVKHLLLSGDNSRPDYDEPGDMRAALVERGVPFSAMTCDYAGFRTLDSIVRAREIFGVSECVIVSDDFHLARALWLADRHGIRATACHGEIIPWERSWKSRMREWLARVRAVGDDLLGTEPKFGGEKITLPVDFPPAVQ